MTLGELLQLRRIGKVAIRQVIAILDLAAFVLLVPFVALISLGFAIKNVRGRVIWIVSILLGAFSLYALFFH